MSASSRYRSKVFKQDYMKYLDAEATTKLEKDFNSLAQNLEDVKKNSKQNDNNRTSKIANKKKDGRGDQDTDYNNDSKVEERWGSAKARDRRLDQQARNILGKTLNVKDFKGVKVLKPTPPKKPTPQKPKTTKRPQDQQKNKDIINDINFTIVSIKIDDEILDFETDTDGLIPLQQIQNYIPEAVGLFYYQSEDFDGLNPRRRVLPISSDGLFIRPPRGNAGWATSKNYEPMLAKTIRVAMTPVQEKKIEKKNDILDGTYDEEANRREFQAAVMAFRNADSEKTPKNISDSRPDSRTKEVNVIQTDLVPTDLKIEFKSSMSALDQLLLKKLRENQTNISPISAKNNNKKSSVQNKDTQPINEVEYERRNKLREIEMERAEIREMFIGIEDESRCIEQEFKMNESQSDSSRTVTPELPNQNQKISQDTLSISAISSMPLDHDILPLQSFYQQSKEMSRPQTASANIRKAEQFPINHRPITPGTTWTNLSTDLFDKKPAIFDQTYFTNEADILKIENGGQPLVNSARKDEEEIFQIINDTLGKEINTDPISAKLISRALSFADSDFSASRPVTAVSTVVDEEEMQAIERAFHLDDEEY